MRLLYVELEDNAPDRKQHEEPVKIQGTAQFALSLVRSRFSLGPCEHPLLFFP